MFGVVGLVDKVERRIGSQGPYVRLHVSLEGGESRRIFFAATDEPEEESAPCLVEFVERGLIREGSRLLFHREPDENEWFRWRGYRDRNGLWKRGPPVSVNVDRPVPVYQTVPYCRTKQFMTSRLGLEVSATERSIIGIVRHRILQRHWRLLWNEVSKGADTESALQVARVGTEDFINLLSKQFNMPDLREEAEITLKTCEEVSEEVMRWSGGSGFFCSEYNVTSDRMGMIGRADFVGVKEKGRREARVIEYKVTDSADRYQARRSWAASRAIMQAATYSKMLEESLRIPSSGAEVWVFDRWTGMRAHRHVCDPSEMEDQLRSALWARDDYLFMSTSPKPATTDYGRKKCTTCPLKDACKRLASYDPHPLVSMMRDALDMETETNLRLVSRRRPSDELIEDGVVIDEAAILDYDGEDLRLRISHERLGFLYPGAVVRISKSGFNHGWGVGTVRRVSTEEVLIHLRDPLTPSILSGPSVRLDLSMPPDFTGRAKMALTAIESPEMIGSTREVVENLHSLRDAVLNPRDVESSAARLGASDLNASQERAVSSILSSKLTVIHGPFGSGKTTVIADAAVRLANSGRKVLITSYTNNAVDNALGMIASRAKALGISIKQVRVGTGRHSSESKDIRLVDTVRFSQEDLEALREADVVGSTVISCLSEAFRSAFMDQEGYLTISSIPFDVSVVDEASQCPLPFSLIPCLISKRWVLVGDHKQLEPLVMDPRARAGLKSWFDMAVQDLEELGRVVMLDIQYRCPHEVGSYLSRQFYGSNLKNDEGDDRDHDHLPIDADKSVSDEINRSFSRAGLELRIGPSQLNVLTDPSNHLIFVDTVGRSPEQGRRSKSNEGEAILSSYLVRLFSNATDSILFLSPYHQQNELVRRMIGEGSGVTMGTVDSYQGRQADIVILSLVRSNKNGMLGFLRNVRRLNVAMSRCLKKLIIISDSVTIRMNRADLGARNALMNYIRYSKELGTYVSLVGRDDGGMMLKRARKLSPRTKLSREHLESL